MTTSRQRLYASLLILGAAILLFRTLRMLLGGAVTILAPWVSALLVAEFLLDLVVIVTALRWWITTDEATATLPLRAAAAMTILHAVRVLVFVLGRTGPWIDFDVRPEHRALHAERWSWGWVWFAAILAILGILGVIVVWRRRRSYLRDPERLHPGAG